MDEIWAEIEGYPNYQISNHGKIKSFQKRKDGRILEKQLKSYVTHGQLAVKLSNRGNSKSKFVARLVWTTFEGDITIKQTIKFKDGNPFNCRLDNLILENRDNYKYNYEIPVLQYENKTGGLTTIPTAVTLVTNRTSITKLEDPVYQKEQADKLFEFLMVFCPHGIFQKLKESILKFDDGLAKLKEKKKLDMNKYNKPYLINSNQKEN